MQLTGGKGVLRLTGGKEVVWLTGEKGVVQLNGIFLAQPWALRIRRPVSLSWLTTNEYKSYHLSGFGFLICKVIGLY